MLKEMILPTMAEEFRSAAEILRELAAQLHFAETQNHFAELASNLERQAQLDEQPKTWEFKTVLSGFG